MKLIQKAVVVPVLLITAGIANASQEVWSNDYEDYVPVDMPRLTIQEKVPANSTSEEVWSNDYEDYVPADMPRLKVQERYSDSVSLRQFDYEENIPGSWLFLGSKPGSKGQG